MGSRVVDLTHSSSPIPLRQTPTPAAAKAMPRPKKAADLKKEQVFDALNRAILTVDERRLRMDISAFVDDNPKLFEQLSTYWLVHGKDVVRYHEDTDDEDDGMTDESTDDDEGETEPDSDGSNVFSESSESRRFRKLKPIALKDEDMTPRYAKCENCKEEFDVTGNERGDCVWHSGTHTLRLDSLLCLLWKKAKWYCWKQEKKVSTITQVLGMITTSAATVLTIPWKTNPTTRRASCGIVATWQEMIRAARRRNIKLPRTELFKLYRQGNRIR